MQDTHTSPVTRRLQRRRAVVRAARALALAAATSGLAACEFLTGVPNVDYVTVTVSPTSIQAGGQSAQAVGIPFREDGSEITHNRRRVALSSSNPAILTVAGSGTGVVTGVAPGQAYVIGTSDGKRDSALVTVLPPLPAIIQFDPTFPTVRVGSTAQVRVIPLNNAGQAFTAFTLQCQSSATGVLLAATSGTSCALSGVSPGQATLSVTVNGAATATVNVSVQQEAYTQIRASVRPVLREGERTAVSIQLLRQDGTQIPITGRQLSFSSSNVTVATVDGNGVLQAGLAGSATITVTGENGVNTTFPVQVTMVPVQTLLLPPNAVYRVDAPNRFQIALLDTAGNTLTDLARRGARYVPADTSILAITSGGIVTPKRAGRTNVTVTVDTITRVTPVTVTEMPVGFLQIDSSQVTRTVGTTFQYTATVLDSLARPVNRPVNIQWTSNNPQAIEIEGATGFVRVRNAGVATITARIVQTDILARTVESTSAFQGVLAVGPRTALRPVSAPAAPPPPPR